MARKRYSAEQIIVKLREAEVLEAKGKTLGEIARVIGTAEQTLIRWRKEYGGLRLEQAKRFKELEKENIRLKRLVADSSLDKAILKDTPPAILFPISFTSFFLATQVFMEITTLVFILVNMEVNAFVADRNALFFNQTA